MSYLLANAQNHVRALQVPLSSEQEATILNQLSDAIAIVEFGDDKHPIRFANPAFIALFETTPAHVNGQRLEAFFPPKDHARLFNAVAQAQMLRAREEVEVTYRARGDVRQFRVTLTPHNETQFVLCIHDITDLANRAHYLEDRAAKLIDHAHGLETSRRVLEDSLVALRAEVTGMARTLHYDPVSGLLNRRHYLERGAAEFQRSRRYGHDLSVVLLCVQGYHPILRDHGQQAADEAVTSVSDLCQSIWRSGTDIGGRTADDEFAVLLPETDLAGALNFIERIRMQITGTPLRLRQGLVRFGLLSAVDTMVEEDSTFMEVMNRAQNARVTPPAL